MNSNQQTRFLIGFLISITVGFVSRIIMSLFIPNYYLILLISYILVAFTFSLIVTPIERKYFYKNIKFHQLFSTSLVWFIGVLFIFCWLGLM